MSFVVLYFWVFTKSFRNTHYEPISLQMKKFIPFCLIYVKLSCSMPILRCRVLSLYIFASGRVRMGNWRAQTGVPCGHSTHTGSTREREGREKGSQAGPSSTTYYHTWPIDVYSRWCERYVQLWCACAHVWYDSMIQPFGHSTQLWSSLLFLTLGRDRGEQFCCQSQHSQPEPTKGGTDTTINTHVGITTITATNKSIGT